MLKQFRHISVHQSSKVLALLHFLLFLVYMIPMSLFLYYSTGDATFFGYLIMPFIVLIFSYIGYAIVFWLYNFIAGTFGGIEVEVQDEQK